MESILALNAASSAGQFLSDSITLVSWTIELTQSDTGELQSHARFRSIVKDLQEIIHSIKDSGSQRRAGTKADSGLHELISTCHGLCDQIQDIIEALPLELSGSRRFFSAAQKAGGALVNRKKLDKLLEELLGLRDQISTHLLAQLMHQQEYLSRALQGFVESNNGYQERIEQKLTQAISTLRLTGVAQDSQKMDRKRQTNENLATSEATYELFKKDVDQYTDSLLELAQQKQERIFRTIHFNQIRERESRVISAHSKTFEWIFDESSTVNYCDWLRHGIGIYWVVGKAGSGKSTLMKFLKSHWSTKSTLRKWAGEHELIIADFFFWNPGTMLQKTTEGLLRSILMQMLHQAPHLTEYACSERWTAPFANSFYPWTREELYSALKVVGTKPDVMLRFCLFIDGLDESTDDHQDLVDMISDMATWPNVKICTSSRPWGVFATQFEANNHKLYLQDLTSGDISRYVDDKLSEAPRFRQLQAADEDLAQSLISEITTKAQGVFLWVYLVVRSLLRGFTNEDEISDLQNRLAELPSELEEYFHRMFSTLENVYKQRAARIFLTMAYEGTSFPLLTFYFLNFDDEPTPLPCEPLPLVRDWPNVDKHKSDALMKKKKQLVAQCKDFIFVAAVDNSPPLFEERVSFLHRTVVDYFATLLVQQQLRDFAGHYFNPRIVMLDAYLRQARSLMHQHRLVYLQPLLKQWVLGILYYAHHEELLGNNVTPRLDELHSIINDSFDRWGFAHGLETLLGLGDICTFLELACKLDLATYVGDRFEDASEGRLDEAAPAWRHPCRIRQEEAAFEVVPLRGDGDLDWRLRATCLLARKKAEDEETLIVKDDVSCQEMSPAAASHAVRKRHPFLKRLKRRMHW